VKLRRHRLAWVASLALTCALGCGASSAIAPSATTAGEEAIDDSSICSGRQGVFIEAPDVEMACADGYRECTSEVVVSVANCGSEDVVLARVESLLRRDGEAGDSLASREYDLPPLAPGSSSDVRWEEFLGGIREITVWVREGSAPIRSAGTVEVEIRNPAIEQARQACEQCEGEWGRAGMLGLEGCSCRTQDSGHPCQDSDDCQGYCLYTHHERFVDAAGQSVARLAGECSERDRMFGCHAIIRGGRRSLSPMPAPPGRALSAPMLCID